MPGKEVLGLLVDGLSYKMIAGKLKITYDTVRAHMKKIYEKLHVASMTEAVAKAINQKLFPVNSSYYPNPILLSDLSILPLLVIDI
jgi:DNA-binding CsgD family transcriptional regulator